MLHIELRTVLILLVLILLVITALIALLTHWPRIVAPGAPAPGGGHMALPLRTALGGTAGSTVLWCEGSG